MENGLNFPEMLATKNKLKPLFRELSSSDVVFLQEFNAQTGARDCAILKRKMSQDNNVSRNLRCVFPQGAPLMTLLDAKNLVFDEAFRVAMVFDQDVFEYGLAALIMMTKPAMLNKVEKLYTHVKDRVAMLVKLTHIKSGRVINFVNFHLDAIRDDHNVRGQDEVAESYHRAQVSDILAKLRLQPGALVVMGGDTNVRLSRRQAPTLCNHLFSDYAQTFSLKDACGTSMRCLKTPTHFPNKFHEAGVKKFVKFLGQVGVLKPARLDLLVTNLPIRKPAQALRTGSLSDHHAVKAYLNVEKMEVDWSFSA
eukprot:CAMPEP_0197635234 /NCGR_PEP_ID=MMETSP1338-20131121/11104_1 /TAXON_ID=43686 ORGANISM="Pelagodinium beii, Strain RCC1491" /NCGR_SAMPLE_ID=MMETSP1338 /ASSEMBLY_ACC=CAM_ASM_000754 /LENGTH=308 /DNA_ID=CAMNT_0043207247 /DNA_START=267 /DNA_END=1193 /DNA_ORIENTATION=-